MNPKLLSVAIGTAMFAFFGAGHGAAWSGVVFGNSYMRGAIVGAVPSGFPIQELAGLYHDAGFELVEPRVVGGPFAGAS